MTTHAVYIKSTLSTSNPSLCPIGGTNNRKTRSGRSSGTGSRNKSRDGHRGSHVYLTPSQQSLHKAVAGFTQQKEEDLETVLDLETEMLPYDDTGKRTYSKACEKLGVVPSSTILSKLGNSKMIDCKHYGLGPKGTMALAIALVVNSKVSSINLRGNDIGATGISYLQKMMCETHTITELILSDNKLGSEGAAAIKKMLQENRSLRRLELAGNNFTDADAELLAKVIQEHSEIQTVDLSHNLFGDLSARLFEDLIAESSSIQTLDLSWNQFRNKGAKYIARGLKENVYMKTFDFSWNGCGDHGANEFAKTLKVNNILTSLDLTACRIGHDGFIKLITALSLNESLLHLKIGKNNIPEEYAEAALSLLRSYPALKLETLDMTDCTFSPKFQTHVTNLNDLHRHLTVLYGYAENYGKNKTDSAADILREGFECLRDYCKDNNVSLVELFEKFDTDSSMSVSLQEFQDGLKEAGVPLSLYKIELFAQALDQDGDGEVDYRNRAKCFLMSKVCTDEGDRLTAVFSTCSEDKARRLSHRTGGQTVMKHDRPTCITSEEVIKLIS